MACPYHMLGTCTHPPINVSFVIEFILAVPGLVLVAAMIHALTAICAHACSSCSSCIILLEQDCSCNRDDCETEECRQGAVGHGSRTSAPSSICAHVIHSQTVELRLLSKAETIRRDHVCFYVSVFWSPCSGRFGPHRAAALLIYQKRHGVSRAIQLHFVGGWAATTRTQVLVDARQVQVELDFAKR